MRMKLHTGRSSQTGIEITFNIFDLMPESYQGEITVSQYDMTVDQKTYKALYFDKTDGTNLTALFPANIPKKCTDDGNIITFSGGMTLDSVTNRYIVTDSSFEQIHGGTQPDNWVSERYKYYCIFPSEVYSNCTIYSNVNQTSQIAEDYNAVYNGGFTVYDTNTDYYYNTSDTPEPDPRQDLFQIYVAATGSMFGIWRNFNMFGNSMCGIGSIYTRSNDCYINNYGINTVCYFSAFGSQQSPYTYNNGKVKNLGILEGDGSGHPIAQSASITIFVSYVYDGVTYYGPALVTMSGTGDTAYPVRIQAQLFSEEYWGESIISGGSSGGEWGPSSVIDGGNGSFSATSDPHGTGDTDDVQTELSTTISALDSIFGGNGGFNIHEILPAAISDVLSVLYSTNFLTRYQQAMYDPMSAILSMHLIPSNLIKFKQTSSKLTASGYDISANMPSGAATTIFPEVMPETVYHVGTIDIGNFFGAFPDYAPYTECILHLPYIGTIKIDTNAIMYGKLAVYYACDAATGNVCAWVWCRDRDENRRNYKYMATGNAAYTIPVAARNNNGLDAGKLLGNVASAVFMGAMGNTLGAGLSAIRAGFQANSFLMPKSTIVEGTFGGNASTLENSMCFLEIIRPEWIQPETFAHDAGIPTYISGSINDLGISGYVEIADIDLENITATETEKEELRKIIYEGFWYNPAE